MIAQLRETATELAAILWREHTVYRDRAGAFVIRAGHVQRWISLMPSGGHDEILIRAGRILEGGTTAPARMEAVAHLSAGTSELAALCRRLLAETAADATLRASRAVSGSARESPASEELWEATVPKRTRKPMGKGRHTNLASWVVLASIAAVLVLWAYSAAAAHR
ncbi:hypothetical protein ACFZAV_21340 [Streptomyces sp. NPDC008343]|uniref:hypothetical protein n=1 Tax=Streptomyces sp. NPDC008343 TaxID=3364828 RepID=UPI0036EDB7AA